MVRIKNAITAYFVDAWEEGTTTDATLELARWISSVTDDTDETVNTVAYYDGDGTPTDDITALKKVYTFEGTFDQEDPAMAFIASLEFETGEARKIAFKQNRTDGSSLFGKATVSAIKVTGGPAEEYPVFECAIAWDNRPTLTQPTPGP